LLPHFTPKFTIRCEGVTWKEGQELLEILKAVQGVENADIPIILEITPWSRGRYMRQLKALT